MFNQEDNDSLKINILYVNKRNELEKINEIYKVYRMLQMV